MDYYLGQICEFTFGYTPPGFLPCQGQLLPIARNAALFSLVGIAYGGDGNTTFALPNLRGKSVLDKDASDTHYYIVVSGVYPPR